MSHSASGFWLAVTAVSLALPALAQDERRQLGVHQHGHGTVNIAIEGQQLSLELDVPAADIVGFEHAPATAEEKAAADRAVALLRDPLSLFVVPAAAGCRVDEVTIGLEPEVDAAAHADYNAEYVLSCAAPAALTSIAFAYFERFSGAEALSVNIVTGRGQGRFEVTRAAPRLDLAALK